MNKTIFSFSFLGMPVKVNNSGLIGSAGIVVLGTILVLLLTDLTPLDAFVAGILMMLIHWFSSIWHHYGHFIAGKTVGKSLTQIKTWWVLTPCRYPDNEGELTPQLHIRRALGGPIASAMMLAIFIILLVLFGNIGGMLRVLLQWGIFVNGAVFLIGSLIPMSIGWFSTDGATILQNWRKMQEAA